MVTMTANLRRRSRMWIVAFQFAIHAVGIGMVHASEPVAEDVAFRAALDGSEQRYIRILPADFDKDKIYDLLIALHGHGSDRRQFAEDKRDECRAARDIAAEYSMIYISPDYRAKTSWMGPAAEADLIQILQDVTKEFKVRFTIVSGASMGGTACLTFAALHPDCVDGVVSMNGTANHLEYMNFQDAISKSFGGTKQEKPEEYRRRSAELKLDRLTMPIACTTGGLDRSVPPESVLRMVEGLKKRSQPVFLIHRPQGGHSTTYADAVTAYEYVIKKLRGNAVR
jgi:dipeptidyl aminopeptidase/acylaminoacyl peptidase